LVFFAIIFYNAIIASFASGLGLFVLILSGILLVFILINYFASKALGEISDISKSRDNTSLLFFPLILILSSIVYLLSSMRFEQDTILFSVSMDSTNYVSLSTSITNAIFSPMLPTIFLTIPLVMGYNNGRTETKNRLKAELQEQMQTFPKEN
jgi:hypothetical protein